MMFSQETAEFRKNCDQLLDLINALRAKTESKVQEVFQPVKKKRAAGHGDG